MRSRKVRKPDETRSALASFVSASPDQQRGADLHSLHPGLPNQPNPPRLDEKRRRRRANPEVVLKVCGIAARLVVYTRQTRQLKINNRGNKAVNGQSLGAHRGPVLRLPEVNGGWIPYPIRSNSYTTFGLMNSTNFRDSREFASTCAVQRMCLPCP